MSWASPDTHKTEDLIKLRELVGRLAAVGASANEVLNNPWSAISRGDWSPAWENQVVSALADFKEKLETLQKIARSVSSRLAVPENGWSQSDLTLIGQVSQVLLNSPGPPEAILIGSDWEEIKARLDGWIEHGRIRDTLRAGIYEKFTEKILHLDLDGLQNQHHQASTSRWPLSWWRMRPVIKAFQSVTKDGHPPEQRILAAVIELALRLKMEERMLSEASDEARAVLGRFWNDGEACWDELESIRNWTLSFRTLAAQVAGDDFGKAAEYRNQWARLATEGRAALNPEAAIGRDLSTYQSSYNDFQAAAKNLSELLSLDSTRAWGTTNDKDFLTKLGLLVNEWSDNITSSQYVIRELSGKIVQIEGPISLALLTKRVAIHWNLTKVTQKAQNTVKENLPKDKVVVSGKHGETFIWPLSIHPEDFKDFRVPGEGSDSFREAEDIPIEEVANAILFVLKSNISAPEKEIIQETSQLFGFRRAGRIVQERVMAGINYLKREGRVQREGESVTLNKE